MKTKLQESSNTSYKIFYSHMFFQLRQTTLLGKCSKIKWLIAFGKTGHINGTHDLYTLLTTIFQELLLLPNGRNQEMVHTTEYYQHRLSTITNS